MLDEVKLNKVVGDINKFIGALNLDENGKWEDPTGSNDLDWCVVRIAHVIPYAEYLASNPDVDTEDVPEGTNQVLYIGVQWWASGINAEVDTYMFGNQFFMKDYEMLDDIDDVLGGGPDIQDATLEEYMVWGVQKDGMTLDNMILYHGLELPDGRTLPMY